MNGLLYPQPQGALMDPRSAMIMQTGLGLMAASGPSRYPVGFGQAFGQAGMQGVNAYNQAQQSNQNAQLFNLKMAEVQREAEERKRKEAALAELKKDPRFANLGPLFDVAPQLAIEQMFAKPSASRTQADARGVLRFVDGPQAGQVVPGFDSARMPEGFEAGPNGRPQPIPEYWEQKRRLAEAGRPSTTIENYPNPIPVVGPDGRPRMVQFGKTGAVQETPYRPYEEPRPPADTERVAGGYASRMLAAERVIQEVGPSGDRSLGTDVAAKAGGYAERVAMSPEQQQVRQAQEDWVRSKLRKESGAVIAKEEMDKEIETYFPMPGDGPEVIAQKTRARATATDAMMTAAGRAAPQRDDRKVLPRSKQFKLDGGGGVIGLLEESTGKYYVMRNGKKFYIEE